MKELIILGKGAIANKPARNILSKEDIPGYSGQTVWTVGTHWIKDADAYLCLHDEKLSVGKKELIPKVFLDEAIDKSTSIYINNSISIMLVSAFTEGFRKIRIAGCPLTIGSEYTEQRESMFMVMGMLRAAGVSVSWDNDVSDYNNYYAEKAGIKYGKL